MQDKNYSKSKILLLIFGPVALLSLLLSAFHYNSYKTAGQRLEGQLFKQQDLITMLAADRVRTQVRELVWGLESLSGSLSGAQSDEYELLSKTFDMLEGRLDGLAQFDADGKKTHSVFRKGSLDKLPEQGRFQEFFYEPRLTQSFYISPPYSPPGGSQFIYISTILKGKDGAFKGAVVGQVSVATLSGLLRGPDEYAASLNFCLYDQQGRPLLRQEDEVLNCERSMPVDKLPAAEKPFGRIFVNNGTEYRVCCKQIVLGGYRWYVYSQMPRTGDPAKVRRDFLMMTGAGMFFIAALIGGGMFFSRVFLQRDQAMARARKNEGIERRTGELAAEKEKLKAVIDALPSGIILLDKGGKVVGINAKMREILDIPSDQPIEEVAGNHALEDLIGPLNGIETKHIGIRAYNLSSVRMAGPAGGEIDEIRLLRDFTGEKLLEQKKKDLISMITHDIRSPLAVITGISGEITSSKAIECLDGETRSGLEVIQRASHRITTLLDNFLYLSDMEAQKLNKEPVDLNVFLGKALLEFYHEAKSKGVALDHDLPEHMLIIPIDEVQMMRAISNLLSNALKYTPEGGKVSVSAKVIRDYVTITISDNGAGIKKEDLPFIYERYFRGGKGHGKRPAGSGLGLAIVKAIVESHGGVIDVASKEGKGSFFTIRLPRNNHQPLH
ncbi:MAG TPA: ATP-binding protein [Nitrospirota bacterium]|jgi:signal transduction histidine kinase